MRTLLVPLALATFLLGCGTADDTRAAPPIGDDAFDVVAPTIDGDEADLRRYAERDLVVWFWAPW